MAATELAACLPGFPDAIDTTLIGYYEKAQKILTPLLNPVNPFENRFEHTRRTLQIAGSIAKNLPPEARNSLFRSILWTQILDTDPETKQAKVILPNKAEPWGFFV